MKQTKMAWEIFYDDDPETVQFSVRFDSEKVSICFNDGVHGVIELESVGEPVEFSFAQLDWLIECLHKIRAEHLPASILPQSVQEE